jgi:predicted ATP-binding protein involved in virulence
VAYYRSNRFALNTFFGNADRRRVKPLDDRLSGYRIYLEPLSDSQHFNKWYRKLVRDVKHSPVTGASNKDSSLQQLTAVNEAVERVLAPTGWHHIDWDETQQSVTAKHNVFGTLPLVVLSSGIRTTIAVAADIAHRCARLNPGLGQDIARRTPGVVLIDEVDLHLHPAWQQLIVELLHTAFPSIQFILSTHSPQVLSTVDSSAIRVIKLRNGIAEMNAPCFQTRGVISADVLAVIMGVDPVPKVPEGQWLSDYRVMIEEGRHDASEGVELRAKLVSHFGSQHPLMLECDRLIRFCDFKRRRAAEGGANASS